MKSPAHILEKKSYSIYANTRKELHERILIPYSGVY